MGKKTDKLYVTHAEHAGEYGGGQHSAASAGHRKKTTHTFASLPFDHCALSLKPFELPVCNPQGICYDLLNIIPYLKKHGTDPVTGEKLASGDLVKLNFSKNANGDYHDPLTFKVFSNHTPIVAIKSSGNVYAKDSVDRLNVKANFWQDLVSNEPFTREDIITLQDPHNPERRELGRFKHLDADLKPRLDDLPGDTLNGINLGATGGTSAVLKSIADKGKAKESSTSDTSPSVQNQPIASTSKASIAPASKAVATTAANGDEPWNASKFSTGHTAASLTSTSAPVFTKTERALYDEEELMFENIKEKGYVKLKTNFGEMNVELFCSQAPRTCYNFLTLAQERKYDDTVFHRLIPGFMVQGGDPTGTGTGGDSMWGKPFNDEYNLRHAQKHDKRGVIAMANSGPNSNKSQFFITFRETPHLNGKHTVFGHLVGGLETLDKLEKIPIQPTTNRPLKPVRLLDVSVFKNPFEEYQTKLAKKLEREAQVKAGAKAKEQARQDREKDRTTWFGTNLGEKGSTTMKPGDQLNDSMTAGLGGVGKYLNNATLKRPLAEPPSSSIQESAPEKKRRKGGFGNFDGW